VEAFLLPGKEDLMAYRKVGYLEQIWYLIRFKLGEIFHRR